MPLSLNDYFGRFSLELIILGIAGICIITNITLSHSVSPNTNDHSVIFSFLKSNPNLNPTLLAHQQTTTILARADQWITPANASGIVLASSTSNSAPTTIQEDVIVKTNPADTQNLRHGKTSYQVQPGDNIISIASSFGISPATIMVENNLSNETIKPGQDLTILPISGISYTLKASDTLEGVADKYKVSIDDLLDINELELASDAQAGDNIIIPTQVSIPTSTKFVTNNSGKIALTTKSVSVPNPGNLNFMWPTVTHNITQGYSSRHSGIDISDSKKEDIFAAEAGCVEIAGFQSNGYGNTIVINHGNGFETRYGHMSQINVTAGQCVPKGFVLGKQGNTGHVLGATGIHLHFEVMVNGRRVNPLSYVKP